MLPHFPTNPNVPALRIADQLGGAPDPLQDMAAELQVDPGGWVLAELERVHDDAMTAWYESLAPATRPNRTAPQQLRLAHRTSQVRGIIEILPPALFVMYAQHSGAPVDLLRRLIGRIEDDVELAMANIPGPQFADLESGEIDPSDAQFADESQNGAMSSHGGSRAPVGKSTPANSNGPPASALTGVATIIVWPPEVEIFSSLLPDQPSGKAMRGSRRPARRLTNTRGLQWFV